MTKLLLRTFSSDETWNADFDYALVDLDEASARALAAKVALVETMKATSPAVVEITFDNALCTFYKGGAFWDDDCELDVDPAAREHFEDFGWCVLPERFIPDGAALRDHEARAEGVYLVVGAGHFYWHGVPRHASMSIDSEVLDIAALAEVFGGP